MRTIKCSTRFRLGCLFLFSLIIIDSCKKKSDSSPVPYHVTLSCYSQNPKFFLKYYDHAGWHQDTIRQSSYQVQFDISESDGMGWDQQMYSVIQTASDSMHIKAEYSGKKVERGFRSISGLFYIGVQLSQAQ